MTEGETEHILEVYVEQTTSNATQRDETFLITFDSCGQQRRKQLPAQDPYVNCI